MSEVSLADLGFNGNKRTGNGQRNHEHIPASVRRQLNADYLNRRAEAVEAATVNQGTAQLAWIKAIERKATRDGNSKAWQIVGEKLFNVTSYDLDVIAKFAEAGFDLDQMIHYEKCNVKILVRWERRPSRTAGLDAQRPTIVSIEKVVSADQTIYSRILELMNEYKYAPGNTLFDSPHHIVSQAVSDMSLPVLAKDKRLILERVEDWLTKWQLAHAAMQASEPEPVAQNVQPVVQPIDPVIAELQKAGEALEALDFAPLFAQSPKREYFTRLLAEQTAPLTTAAPILLLPATIPDRPVRRPAKTTFVGMRRIIPSGPTLCLPPPTVALLPEFSLSTLELVWRVGQPDRGEDIIIPTAPGRLPIFTMSGQSDDIRQILVGGKPICNVKVVPVDFEDVRVEHVEDYKRGDGRTHPSPYRTADPIYSHIADDDLNEQIRAAFMKGASRV